MKRLYDTVKCPMLGMTIKMSRCNLTSKQELDFWGPNAAQFNRGCPCEKRKVTIMAKRNCEGCGLGAYPMVPNMPDDKACDLWTGRDKDTDDSIYIYPPIILGDAYEL